MPKRKRPDPPPPVFLIDRCLVIDLESELTHAGYEATHLANLFPGRDQDVQDDEILEYADQYGMVILTKNRFDQDDESVRRALRQFRGRCFCLTNRQLKRRDQIDAFIEHIAVIVRLCRKPGPYVYGIYRSQRPRILWSKKGEP